MKAAALRDLKGTESIHLFVLLLPPYRVKEKREELCDIKLNCSSGEQERGIITRCVCGCFIFSREFTRQSSPSTGSVQ